MLNKKELKELIGKNIWVIPTNNSVNRTIPIRDQIREVTLLKMGNSIMTLKELNARREYKVPSDGGCDNYNFGYKPFASLQDAQNHLEMNDIVSEIKHSSFNHLSYEKIKQIQSILKS